MEVTSDLSPEQEQWVRAQLLARLQRQFAKMSTCAIRSIAWYADIKMADRSCATPAEDFIGSLVREHHHSGLTPAEAANYREEFRDDFEYALGATREFNTHYPKLVESSLAS